jgi:ATP-dependent RNA helicase RhlE
MFSATFSREIETLTHQFQRNPKTVQIGRRADPATTVTQLVYEVRNDLKMSLLLHLLRDPGLNMVLLFSRTKHGADKVARKLEERGIRTGTLHSNRSQNQRLRALKDFKNGSIRVLVATDIAARGIDVDGISHVVNYDFPKHPEDYVHRIGRTGRAHAVGDALSFATPEDHSALRALERFIGRGLVRKRADGFDYQSAPVRRPELPNRGDQSGTQHRHIGSDRRATGRGEWRSDVRKALVHGKHASARPQSAPHRNANRFPAQRPMAATQRHATRPQTQGPTHPGVPQSGVRPLQTAPQPPHRHGNASARMNTQNDFETRGAVRSYPDGAMPRPTSKGNANRFDRWHGRKRFHRRAKTSKPFWAKR